MLASRVTVNAEIRGSKISYKNLNFAPLILSSLLTFKRQVKRFEKYIITIKPRSPEKLSVVQISIILIEESEIAVKKVYFCWSSPFKMPSDMLSRYISGTIGDKAFKR